MKEVEHRVSVMEWIVLRVKGRESEEQRRVSSGRKKGGIFSKECWPRVGNRMVEDNL